MLNLVGHGWDGNFLECLIVPLVENTIKIVCACINNKVVVIMSSHPCQEIQLDI